MLLFQPAAPPREPLLAFSITVNLEGNNHVLHQERGRARRSGQKCFSCKLGSGALFIQKPTKSERTKEYIAHQVGEHMRDLGLTRFQGPLAVLIQSRWPRLKSPVDRKHPGRQWKPTRVDVDNAAKLVLDALNGVAYADDGQVVDLRALTVHGGVDEPPGIDCWIYRVDLFPPHLSTVQGGQP